MKKLSGYKFTATNTRSMKYFALIIALTSSALTFAQVERHLFMASGSLSYRKDDFDFSGTRSYKNTLQTFRSVPKIGYFFINRLCGGIHFPYQWQKFADHSTPPAVNVVFMSYNIGPFAKYYQPFSDRFYGTLQGAFSWGTEKTERSNVAGSEKETSKFSTIGIGLSYFVNKNIAVEIEANFMEDFIDDDNPNLDYVYTDHLDISLGMQIFFRGKKTG
jgi:hypothetical protein